MVLLRAKGTGVVRDDLSLSHGGAPWWYINPTRLGRPQKMQ